jgi:mannose-6-phosphate isomerase-like protein (cupin superfamily)
VNTVDTKTLRLEKKGMANADEVRAFDKGHLALVTVGNVTFGRAVFQPGWAWSESVKPIAKTAHCEVGHVGFIVSGRMKVVMTTGDQIEFGPGDAVSIPPGHDAWIVGDEPCVYLEVAGASAYAKPQGEVPGHLDRAA